MDPNSTNYYHVMEQFANVRKEEAQTESDLKSAIYASSDQSAANFRALENTLSRNAATAAKDNADILFRLHDNIRTVTDTILTSTALTNSKVAESQYALAEKMNAFERNTSEKFAVAAVAAEKNTSAILAALAGQELRAVQDELNEKRMECVRHEGEITFGNRLSIIQSQLNDLSQRQQATNQAINFGTGLIGPQTNTSNQVR